MGDSRLRRRGMFPFSASHNSIGSIGFVHLGRTIVSQNGVVVSGQTPPFATIESLRIEPSAAIKLCRKWYCFVVGWLPPLLPCSSFFIRSSSQRFLHICIQQRS